MYPGTSSTSDNLSPQPRAKALFAVALAVAILLAYKSTDLQIARLGRPYVAEVQARSHRQAVDGFWNRSIRSIYHYRLLSVLVVESVHQVTGLPIEKALSYSLFVFRGAAFAMWLWVFYLMRLSWLEILAALLLVFYAVVASIYNEDMNHFEPLNQCGYLLFLALVLKGGDRWLWLVVAAGSLAKETAVFMPLIYFAYRVPFQWRRPWQAVLTHAPQTAYTLAMGSLSFAIYLAIRWFFSVNSPTGMIEETRHYGWGSTATWFNLTNPYTYIQWAVCFHVLLVLPFLYWREKPPEWRRMITVFCAVFFVAHFITTRQEEVRMFLVFLAVLVPMSLDSYQRLAGERAGQRASNPFASM